MADYPMGPNAGVHRPVIYMQVRAANSTIGNAYLDFALAGCNRLHGFNRKTLISGIVCCFHVSSLI